MTGRTVLVIGATGILAPAARLLAARGDHVLAVSYRGAKGTIGVDATDPRALAIALGHRAWHDAVVYGPAVSADSLEFVRTATAGRCVLVRTSTAVDAASTAAPGILQLGWTVDEPRRWHTPDEVSAAAVQVLDDGEGRVLGAIRPWSDRP